MALFSEADLPLSRSSAVNYTATINDPRIESVRILRPQEIPRYVQEGTFDFGITGARLGWKRLAAMSCRSASCRIPSRPPTLSK